VIASFYLDTLVLFISLYTGVLGKSKVAQNSASNPIDRHWDYSGPYHGYDGFAIFARDMDLALNSPTWGLIGAPWNQKAQTKAKAKASV
jgi:nitrogenase molybdenum-iron protein alpha/beta subunit